MCRRTIDVCTSCTSQLDNSYTWCRAAIRRLGEVSYEHAKCPMKEMEMRIRDEGVRCEVCKPLPTPPARTADGKKGKGKGKGKK